MAPNGYILMVLASLVAATEQGQVYMLAFTNLTTDDPSLKSIQQLRVSTNTQKLTKVGIFHPYQGKREQHVLWAGNNYTYQTTTEIDLAVATGSGITHKGILIVSDNPISVYANKAAQGTTDGYLALPVTKRSKAFFVPSFDFIPLGHATFAIAAVYNDTCVEAYTWENGTYTRSLSIHMDEAEVFHSFSQKKDLTGTFINSTRPIAVYGGHECAQVPLGKKFCDNLIEQVPPVADWGTDFYLGPIMGRNQIAGYTLRVIASQEDTLLTFTRGSNLISPDTVNTTLARGRFSQHNVSSTQEMSHVVCSKPCLVVQYNSGMRNGGADDIQTDAWMTIIPPVSHMGCQGNVTFGTSSLYHKGLETPFSNFVTVIAETADKNDISLDGASLSWTDVGKFKWSWAWKAVSPGFHSVVSTGTRKFAAFVYGHAMVEPTGYGYPACYDVGEQVHGGSWFVRYNDPLPANHTYGGGNGGGGQPINTCTDVNSVYRPSDAKDAAVGSPLDMFTLSAPLKNAGRGSCGLLYLNTIKSRATVLLEAFNNDICRKSTCRSRVHPMGINDIKVKLGAGSTNTSVESLDIAVEIGSNPDEPIGNYLACRKEVSYLLTKNVRWTLPVNENGCLELQFEETKMKILPQWSCY